MAEDESEYLKLPVDERCVHKSWKARVSGYEEAKKLFVQWDEDDANWKKYMGIIKKMVTDSNAVAQEKGLDCVLLFTENCKSANKAVGEIIDGLVTKCVAAPKTKTKELATQIIMMCTEIEAHEKVIEGLLGGLAQKNPKIVSACVYNVTEVLKGFGAKVIKISPLLKAVIPLLDHRDKDVREEGKKLIIESYRWIGSLMKSQLTGVKPVQMTEFEAEFEKVEAGGRAAPTRWLRSAGPPKQEKAAEGGADEGDEDEEEDSQDSGLDPYEMLDPVEIISKLPKNFFEQVEEKKWQLRKESLDALLPLTQNPKLLPGDYNDLVKVLKKFINKDTNVMLVALATQCLTGLAKGLRGSFKNLANNVFSSLLEKFKEKKLNVVTALRECVDAIYPILGIEAIQEDMLAALKHKTPAVKSETGSFLARCFSQCPALLLTNKKVLKGYISALLETLNESDPGVRESSAEALGALVKFMGEGKVFPLMPDLDNLKQEKIKEKAEKIELSGKKAPSAKSVKPEPKAESKSGARIVKPEPGKPRPAPSKPSAPPVNKKVVKGGGAKGPGGAKKTGKGPPGPPSAGVASESDISTEEAEARAEELIPADVFSGLGDMNWKNRLAAMETFKSRISSADNLPGLLAVKLLCRKPGLKDNNFQVLGLRLSALSQVAQKCSWSQQCWDTVFPDIVEKLSDKKNIEACKVTLFDIAESCSFNFVFTGVLEGAFAQKNPAVKAEALNWAGEGIKMFGFGGLQSKAGLEAIKKGLGETNPAVRTASIGLLGILHWYIGSTAKRMFEDEKPAVLQQIDAECSKYAGESLPIPTRGKVVRSSGEDEEEDEDEVETVVEDLVPRKNISGELNDQLLENIKDKNWKIRKEGLDKLKDIINSAKFITNDLGGLPPVLCSRTTDTNKILATQALDLVGELALAMGPQTRTQIPQLVPAVLAALADSKNTVRAAAIATLNIFIKETSFKDLLVNEIISSALIKGNPNTKQELLNWLKESMGEGKGLNKDELVACLPTLYASIEDRAAEVRKPAQEAVLPFMKHLGYDAMRKAADKLSAVSKNTVMPILEKARAELPAPTASSKPRPAVTRDDSVETARVKQEEKSASKPEQKSTKPQMKSRLGLNKPSAQKKGAEEMDSSPLYQANKLKSTRFRDESKLKTLKWNFATPRQEFVDQLKDQITAAGFNKSLFGMMFHADFKQHLKAIEMLSEHCGTDIDGLISNLDLLLKWMTLRFFETNPSVNIKGLEYLCHVFGVLAEYEEGYMLHELEASAFLPYLINKMGDPKDQIRSCCRTILNLTCNLYPASKLFPHLMNGLGTKNAKQRAECLEELGTHIRKQGVSVAGAQPPVALKEIAKQIADRDTGVRNAALNAVTEAYFKEGEKLYKMIGNIPEKDLAMLEERIKRSSKSRPQEPEPIGQPSDPQRKPSKLQIKTGMRPPSAPSAGMGREGESDIKLRLQQARATSAAPGARPVSGVFSLDLEKIEGRSERISDTGPKLVEHNLDDIMNCAPVMLPITRTGMQRMMSPENNSARCNQEAHQAVTAVIAQIFNPDIQVSVNALGEIEELLKHETKAELIEPCIDHLFSTCAMQYRYVVDSKMNDSLSNEKDILRQLQFLTMVVMSAYGLREQVKKASMQVLHDLMHMIISVLLEPATGNLPEGGQLVRAMNVLTVKIVDRSDPTCVFVALLKLLHGSVGNAQMSEKYGGLVMKCVWKCIRAIPTWLPTLDVGSLMLTVHEFLKVFPSSYWKTVAEDTPLRTIKTLLHTLVKVLGEDLLNCLGRIQDPNSSELVPFIRKMVSTVVGSEGGETKKPDSARKRVPRFSKSDHEALAEIFKKIGQKELSKVGLQELYNFKQENPQADLEPFLAKSSQYFREYIERGLRSVELQVQGGGGVPASTAGGRSSVLVDSNTTTGQPTHLVYLERLKRLRAAGGLQTLDQENRETRENMETMETNTGHTTNSSSGYSSGISSAYSRRERFSSTENNYQSESTGARSSEAPNVDEIRKRLAKIKQAAF